MACTPVCFLVNMALAACFGVLVACLVDAWCGSDPHKDAPANPPTEQSALVTNADANPTPITTGGKTATGPPSAPTTAPAPPPYNSNRQSQV